MPLFRVRFEKEIEVIVEATSLEECKKAAESEKEYINYDWFDDGWDASVYPIKDDTFYAKKGPECFVDGDRIRSIEDKKK